MLVHRLKLGEELYTGYNLRQISFRTTSKSKTPAKQMTSGATLHSVNHPQVNLIVKSEKMESYSTGHFTYPTQIRHLILDDSGQELDYSIQNLSLGSEIIYLRSGYDRDPGELRFSIKDIDGKTKLVKKSVTELIGKDHISMALLYLKYLKVEYFGKWEYYNKFQAPIQKLQNRILQLEEENKKLHTQLQEALQ